MSAWPCYEERCPAHEHSPSYRYCPYTGIERLEASKRTPEETPRSWMDNPAGWDKFVSVLDSMTDDELRCAGLIRRPGCVSGSGPHRRPWPLHSSRRGEDGLSLLRRGRCVSTGGWIMNWEDYKHTSKGSDVELACGHASVEYTGLANCGGETYEQWKWEVKYDGAVALAANGVARSLRKGKDAAARVYEVLAEASGKLEGT